MVRHRVSLTVAAITLLCFSHTVAVLTPSPTQLVVNISSGQDTDGCGSLPSPCRTIHYAVKLAAPYSVINVANGTYACGLYVSIPLSFVALDSGVFLDCGGTQRGIFFDSVPAQVDGFNFINGFGEGAGGIVSVQQHEHPYLANSILRSTFSGCTGIRSLLFDGAAGAVLIVYKVNRLERITTIARSTFERNYARGDARPAGAINVWLPEAAVATGDDDLSPRREVPKCDAVVVDPSEGTESEATVRYYGVYRRMPTAFTSVSGFDAYNSLGRLPTEDDGTVRVNWILFCEKSQVYGFTSTQGAMKSSPPACAPEIAGSNLMEKEPLTEYEWWMASGGVRTRMQPTCQDKYAASCNEFTAANVPAAQAGRHGFFTKASYSVANRPVFVANGDTDSHYIWYCRKLQEWIFTDVDPQSQPPEDATECERGITSKPTFALHPAAVFEWKYWNNVTSQWNPALSPRHAGMHLVCHTIQPCTSVELLHAPLEKAASFSQTRHHGTNVFSENRPVYGSATTTPTTYLSYCAQYAEWMVHEDNPYLHQRDVASTCERSFTSGRTFAVDSSLVGSWAIGRGSEWEHSSVDVVCNAGCSYFSLFVTMKPQTCAHCGDYRVAGVVGSSKFYRQVLSRSDTDAVADAHQHIMFFDRASSRWVVAASASLDQPASMVESAVLVGDGSPDDVFSVRRWSLVQPSSTDGRHPTYGLSCIALQNCSMVHFVHDDFASLSGEFYRTARAVNQRASYATSAGATMQFSAEHSAWLISHPSVNVQLLSSPTRAVVPSGGLRWDRKISAKGKVLQLTKRGGARCVGTVAPRVESAGPKGGDVISDCHFHGNMALSELLDGTPVGGAVQVLIGSGNLGAVVRTHVRNVTLVRNEAAAVRRTVTADGVGGVSIVGSDRESQFVTMSDITALHNHADRGGGLAMDNVRGVLSRITIKHNSASYSGGGMASYNSFVNVSNLVCAHNHARVSGGCITSEAQSRLYLRGMDALNNTAGSIGSMVSSRGFIHLLGSKVERMLGLAFTGTVLLLVESQLFCGQGRAMTFIGGFGCQHDPEPTLPSGTTTPVVPIDANEAWWIWAANGCSMLAQGMLSLTMAVFALQYCMAHHLANVMPTARQLQASRWRANQRQLEQQQEERGGRRR